MAFSHGTNHSKGVMILINPSLDCKIEKLLLIKMAGSLFKNFHLMNKLLF